MRSESHFGPNLSSRSSFSLKYHFATVSDSVSALALITQPDPYGLGSPLAVILYSSSFLSISAFALIIAQSLFNSSPLQFSLKFVMEITEAYAIAAGGVFLIFIFINFRPYIARLRATAALLTDKYLTYPQVLRRHRFLGPWSGASVFLQLLYISVNALCLGFGASSIWTVGLRAANLSLINLIPLFAGPHLSLLADLLDITLRMFRRFHRSARLMSFVLLVLHILTMVAKRTSFSLHNPENLFGLIVSHLVLPSHTDH